MLVFHGETDVGKRRSINEDAIHAGDGLFLVSDGLGGHQAGEVASSLAVETIARFVQRSDEDRELTWPYGFNPQLSYNGNRLATAIKLANRAVFRKANSSDSYSGMGATVVAALVSGDSVMTYASVGDSRLYLIRGDAMLQLTRDDSWSNLGWPGAPTVDTMATAAMKHVLTKALGARDDVEFEAVDHPLHVGDIVLLCSDGLTNMLSDERILAVVAAGRSDLAAATRQLVAEANGAGGRDNISAILLARQA